MTPKITDEMRKALAQHPDGPVPIEDDRTRKLYILVAEDEFRRLSGGQLLRELQIGFDQADRGESADWNPENIKAQGREYLRRRSEAA